MNFFGYLVLLVSLASSPMDSDKQKTGCLRIMTYNMRIANPPAKPGVTDLPAIAQVINLIRPDLVALQEVDVFTKRSGLNSDQPKELAELTGMNYFFAKAIDRSGGSYGVAILSRFPITDTLNISLPVIPGTHAELRNAALTVVKISEKQKIVFISTHLDHLKDSNRILQSKVLLQKINSFSQYPIILAGDFNTDISSKNDEVAEIFKKDYSVICSECPFSFSAASPWTTIDFILLNKRAGKLFNVLSYKSIDEKYASDHLPIIAELKIAEINPGKLNNKNTNSKIN